MHSQLELIKIIQEPFAYNDIHTLFEDKTHEQIYILEHQDVYTAGKSVKEQIEKIHNIPAVNTDRGGLWTWHGKGQIIVYFNINLRQRKMNLDNFFSKIEPVFINLIQSEINTHCNNEYASKIQTYADKDKRGFWIKNLNTNEVAKIGFIGLHISKGWLTHGISINYNNDLKWFDFIDPCGLGKVKITSIEEIVNHDTLHNKIELNIEKLKLKIKEKMLNCFD